MTARKKGGILMLNCKAFENYVVANTIYFQSFMLVHYGKGDCSKQFNVDQIGTGRMHQKTLVFKAACI